jgi:hypothetical protein
MSIPLHIAPRVFVSYSWTSDGHAAWVMELAARLRTDGVDVILDRWDLLPGQDKFAFMEKMVSDASVDRVVVICDQRYAQKADARQGGVGTESTIISQQIYEQSDSRRFVAVVAEFDDDAKPFLPVFLKGRIYFDLSDPRRYESAYEDLVRDLCGRPRHAKPPLGKLPTFLLEEGRRPAATTYARRAFEDAVLHDRRHASGLARDYLIALEGEWSALSEALRDDLKSQPSEKEENDFQTLKIWQRCEELLPLRDEFTDFVAFSAQYGGDRRIFDELPLFFERSLRFCHPNSQRPENQLVAFALKESFLYSLVVLIAAERFEAAGALLSRYYRDSSNDTYRNSGLTRFGVFDAGFELLIDGWHLGLHQLYGDQNWGSAEAKVFQARSTDNRAHPLVSFEALQEVDFILSWRQALDANHDRYDKRWWPCMVHNYFQHRDTPLEICVRARSKSYFQMFRLLLGVGSKEEMQERSQIILKDGFAPLKDGWGDYERRFEKITNFSQLDVI